MTDYYLVFDGQVRAPFRMHLLPTDALQSSNYESLTHTYTIHVWYILFVYMDG